MDVIKPQFIERTRGMPFRGQPVVSVGDFVTEEQVVARLPYVPAQIRRVAVARELRMPNEDMHRFLSVKLGDQVEEGSVLASAYLFGERRVVSSPIAGFVGLISRHMGQVYIHVPTNNSAGERPVQVDLCKELHCPPEDVVVTVVPGMRIALGHPLAHKTGLDAQVTLSPLLARVISVNGHKMELEPIRVRHTVQAYLRGRVVAQSPEVGVTIRSYARVIKGNYGVGGESGGPLLIVAHATEDTGVEKVSEEWRGKIVVAGRSITSEALLAAYSVGCHGVVVGSVPWSTLTTYAGQGSLPGITGTENVTMPVIITERFSLTSMRQDAFATLKALEGRYASISGITHIRAGAVRPEVVVSEPNREGESRQVPQANELRAGARVRVLREPACGAEGVVVALPHERRVLPTGAKVHVAIIRQGKEIMEIPISNIAVIQGGMGSELDPG